MRWPLWRVAVAERSMEPALRPGDWLLVRRGMRARRPPRIGPGQVVIAGHRGAVERAMVIAKQRGAKRAVMLPMSAPSHCSLMKPAAERLAKRLEAVEVKKPLVPVIHNRFVESFDDPARIRQALVEQLCNPVRWIETIEFLGHKGVRRVVECGPGKVLTGLSKRIVPDIEYIALNDAATLAAASAQV